MTHSPEEAHAAAIEAATNVWRLQDTEPADWIAAYLAALRASGYVVVPVEPTDVMIEAALDLDSPFKSDAYAAMVSAAPTFPPEAE